MDEFHLKTPRIYLRRFADMDAQGFYRMNADAVVLQFTGDQPFPDQEAALAFIRSYDHYQKHGYGRWSMVLQETNQFIGFCGLKYHEQGDYTDLGFRLDRAYWGRGLATEAAHACIEYAFTKLKLPLLVGRVQQRNLASVRVLEKLGMRRIKSFDFEGVPGYWYELRNELAD